MASTSKDVRYHKLSTQEGEGSSGRTRRNSVSRRNFTNRKRVLPKVVAIGFVFCILLLFQYGSHIFNSITDDIEDDIRSNDITRPVEDSVPKPFKSNNLVKATAKLPGNADIALSDTDLKQNQPTDDHESELPEALDPAVRQDQVDDRSHEYQLNLKHCKIPALEIRSENYMKFENSIKQIETCENEKEYSILEDGVVHLNPTFDRKNCCVQNITRPEEFPADTYDLGECEAFDEDNKFQMGTREFVQVSCNVSGTKYFNYHTRVVPSKFQSKIDYWKDKRKPVNILILVLDSTSHTDAHRNLPKTMDYLLNELNFVEFNGYHVLSEPTIRNALPMLLGINEFEFYKTKAWVDYWDSVPFIWDTFRERKYLTGYLEDIPSAGTFNYGGQKGFVKQPTDFYTRPILAAYEDADFASGNLKPNFCIGKKPIEAFLLEYQLDILKKMAGQAPLFLMPWTCWPQHDHFGTLFHVDNITFNFFSQIGKSDILLENTVLILMADHGFYGGPYAQTHEGLLERRHPLFAMRLPKALTDSRPEFLKNVQDNANVITSHYDFHKTLEHLAELSSLSSSIDPEPPEPEPSPTHAKAKRESHNPKPTKYRFQNKYGQSLLSLIPKTRTCEEAGIEPPRCACNLPPPSPPPPPAKQIQQASRSGFGSSGEAEVDADAPGAVTFPPPRPYVDRSPNAPPLHPIAGWQ